MSGRAFSLRAASMCGAHRAARSLLGADATESSRSRIKASARASMALSIFLSLSPGTKSKERMAASAPSSRTNLRQGRAMRQCARKAANARAGAMRTPCLSAERPKAPKHRDEIPRRISLSKIVDREMAPVEIRQGNRTLEETKDGDLDIFEMFHDETDVNHLSTVISKN